MIKFEIPIEPFPQQRAKKVFKNGKMWGYLTKEQQSRQDLLDSYVLKHAPKEPIQGAIQLKFHAFFLIPKSYTKKQIADIAEQGYFHTKKIDIDNIAKALLDSMTRCRYWIDDSQVSFIICAKSYTPVKIPRWEVEVYKYDNNEISFK